jgi:membrane-anchored protein YejM (alkaline phosphatase superfamily)
MMKRKDQKIPNYKYNEDKALSELKEYIDSTYDEHYSKNKFQATEFIIDGGHGEGFCIGNIMKYAQRYGKKDGYNKRDLQKVLHYGIIALHNHDIMEKQNNEVK